MLSKVYAFPKLQNKVYQYLIKRVNESYDEGVETSSDLRKQSVADLYNLSREGYFSEFDILKDIKEISGGVRKGETVVFDLKQNEKGSAVFVNEKKEWQDWSDDSYCENVIPGKAGDAK